MNATPEQLNPQSSTDISDLQVHLGYWLRFVSNEVSARFKRQVEAQGVSVSDWVVLREIYRLQCTSPTQLQQLSGMSKGAISKIITRLLDKDLIARAVLAHDRRNHEVMLTAEGLAIVPTLAKLADENDALFFGHLSDSARETLMSTLQELVRVHQMNVIPVE